jgi:hypothetical protein
MRSKAYRRPSPSIRQSGAHVALDGRHDDGAERSPEAPLRARGRALLPRMRCARTS